MNVPKAAIVQRNDAIRAEFKRLCKKTPGKSREIMAKLAKKYGLRQIHKIVYGREQIPKIKEGDVKGYELFHSIHWYAEESRNSSHLNGKFGFLNSRETSMLFGATTPGTYAFYFVCHHWHRYFNAKCPACANEHAIVIPEYAQYQRRYRIKCPIKNRHVIVYGNAMPRQRYLFINEGTSRGYSVPDEIMWKYEQILHMPAIVGSPVPPLSGVSQRVSQA